MNRVVKFPLVTGAVGLFLIGCGGGGGGTAARGPLAGPSIPVLNGVTARFHVNVASGQVSILKSTASPSLTRSIFGGTTIGFNTSTLVNMAGNNGLKVLNVSLTNNAGLTIGSDPNGNSFGLNVLFSGFSNVGTFPDVTNLTSVSTVATGFDLPYGCAYGANGVIYVADTFHNQIKMVSQGSVSVLAGSGKQSETDGQGQSASFSLPVGIAVNPIDQSLIVADDGGYTIRRVTPTGQVNTIAGTGASGSSNGTTGASATFNGPWGVAVDTLGNIYVTETRNSDIRKIQFNSGSPTVSSSYTVSTLAGGVAGFADGSGVSAEFESPYGIAASSGNLYVADTGNNAVRMVTTGGVVTTIAGTGSVGTTDGVGTAATFTSPTGISVVNGSVVVSEGRTTNGAVNIRQITPIQGASTSTSSGWQTATIAGTGALGDVDGAGNVAEFNNPMLLTSTPSGTIYLPDTSNNALRQIVPDNGLFPVGVPTTGTPATELVQLSNASGQLDSSTAGLSLPYINYTGALPNGQTSPVQQWAFSIPQGVTAFEFNVTVQAAAQYLVPPNAQTGQGDPTEVVSTYAGNSANSGNQNGATLRARFNGPLGVCYYPGVPLDPLAGTLLVADWANNQIRMILPSGQVETVAGYPGRTEVDGAGNAAGFNGPSGIVAGPADTFYVADAETVRLLVYEGGDPTNSENWNVSTIAGTNGTAGDTQGAGGSALFTYLTGIARDPSGDLFVVDQGSNNVRRVQFTGGDPTTPADYQVFLLAGSSTGVAGHTNGAGATKALFSSPVGVAEDSLGDLYVSDSANFEIRKITPDGNVTNVAGTFSTRGYVDGSSANLFGPQGITVDSANYVYFTDSDFLVRRLSPGGVVSTVAGTNTAGNVDGTGNIARFELPTGITITPGGDIYVLDQNAIRVIQKQVVASPNSRRK